MMAFIRSWVNKISIKRKIKSKNGKLEKPLSIIGRNFYEFGKGVNIKKFCRIEAYKEFCGVKLNPKLTIGNNVIIMYFATILVEDEVSIGDDTILASNVSIVSGNHGHNLEMQMPYASQPIDCSPVIIGSNCWIGQNAVLLPGTVLGNNCIVGANAVVNKIFPDNVMIAGVPAKVIKKYDFEKQEWIAIKEVNERKG